MEFKFPMGRVVRRTDDGTWGVTTGDRWSVCDASVETPVIYPDSTGYHGTDNNLLQDIEPYRPVADFEKCGAGKGAETCVFLIMTGKGFECGRMVEDLHGTLLTKEMNAKRKPMEMFPDCQI